MIMKIVYSLEVLHSSGIWIQYVENDDDDEDDHPYTPEYEVYDISEDTPENVRNSEVGILYQVKSDSKWDDSKYRIVRKVFTTTTEEYHF
jgi:hypothetical protein